LNPMRDNATDIILLALAEALKHDGKRIVEVRKVGN